MTLQRRGRLVRWAYFFSSTSIPERTTLCAFFWRAFVFVPTVWFVIAVLVFSLGFIGIDVAWHHPLKAAGMAAGFIGFFFFMSWFEQRKAIVHNRVMSKARDRVAESVFVHGVKSIKSKFCPIIDLE